MGILDNLDLSALFAPGNNEFAPQAPAGLNLPPGLGGAPPMPEAGPAPPPMLPPSAPQGLLPPPAPSGFGRPGGLVNRITQTSPDGLTFQDKLMALGSMLKGDDQGGQQYLAGQRAAYKKTKDQDEAKALLKKRSAAFFKAMSSGHFDPAVYATESQDAFDPDELAKLQGAFVRKPQFMNSGPNIIRTDPDTGTATEVYKGHEKSPIPGTKYDENGNLVIDDVAMAAIRQAAGAKAEEVNRYKKFAPHAGGGVRSHIPAGATPLPP